MCSDDMESKALSDYFRILRGERNANYLESKQLEIDFDLNAQEEKLWETHDEVVGKKKENPFLSLFDLKLEISKRMLEKCRFCERRCYVNREKGQKGYCGVLKSKIASEFIHMGEEPELVPSYTIFFSGCTFNCVFCQNWDISQYPEAGIYVEPRVMAKLIEQRKNNIKNLNWVGGEPTPNLPYILEVLSYSSVNLPVIWNSNMYMSEETMKLLNNIVDVYLTDFKYGNDDCAKKLSNIENYFNIVSRNHRIANQQCDVIIRHLVLPNHVECCSKPVLKWIAENLRNVKVNVMAQYRPEHKAKEYPEINRRITKEEFDEAVNFAEELGLDLVE